ncbi:hypothetical protein [Daejeonella sp.]|jgi:hypothetical protein|uniref:hypothetical protein n=1 Tax=Daejeonella sp. TaxID=2805397 RepID=UPI0037C11F03
MKKYSKLVVFILLFYSCKEKLNEPKQENINTFYQQTPLDVSPIFDSIDGSRIPAPPALPPTEEGVINIDLQVIGNVKLPKIVARNKDELLRKSDRQLAAIARYLRRDDPTYKISPIPGVSMQQLDDDYESFFKKAEKERAKIEKNSKLSAKKLFGN